LNGVQLWAALPDHYRNMNAGFQQVNLVPRLDLRGGFVEVFAGAFEAAVSPARHYSEILGADVRVHPGGALTVPLDAHYEHAAFVLSGDCSIAGQPLAEGMLYYLGVARTEAGFESRGGGRLLLIGGPPFPERILMWWNFVARTPQEIAQARSDWETRQRFGEVASYAGARLAAPELMRLAVPNPLS
jgi:hypothetical protein